MNQKQNNEKHISVADGNKKGGNNKKFKVQCPNSLYIISPSLHNINHFAKKLE